MTGCLALIRVRIPDRPGALGLVASRIGSLKGDIVGIEVLGRADGSALDEVAVVLPDAALIPALTREIAEVDGASAESVTVVDELPAPRVDALRTATAMSRARDLSGLVTTLLDAVSDRFRPTWCAAVGPGFVTAVGDADGLHEQSTAADAIRDAASHHVTIGDDRMTVYLARVTALSVGEANALTAYCDLADALGRRFEEA